MDMDINSTAVVENYGSNPLHTFPQTHPHPKKKKRHDMALLRKLQSILVACPNHSAETYG
jgi:hypothetical protein